MLRNTADVSCAAAMSLKGVAQETWEQTQTLADGKSKNEGEYRAGSHRSPPRCVDNTPGEAMRPTVIPQEWTVTLNVILTWRSRHWKTSNWKQAAVIPLNNLEIGDY